MGKLAKPINRVLFLICVALTGAIAGAFVWAFFFLMDTGLSFVWNDGRLWLSGLLEQVAPSLARGSFGVALFPFLVCLAGGLIIGLYEKKTHIQTEDLNTVVAKVKTSGRYEYDGLGKRSIAALLPLLFGGSIGPEAGLTGVIAGLCTWVGDRLRRFGSDFRTLTVLGIQAALTALFTAPLYGFVAPLVGYAEGKRAGKHSIHSDFYNGATKDEYSSSFPKAIKIVVYAFAIAGALVAYMGLGQLFGGGFGMPRFDAAEVGVSELAWLVPVAVCATLCGWVYHASNKATKATSKKIGNKPVIKAVLAGLVLAVCGTLLPYTLFAGESQTHMVMDSYTAIPAAILIVTGLVKAAVTPLCINWGWRGGHFFPLIFSGVCLGYGFALLIGIDAVFCVAISVAALLGAVMRKPVMVVLLLFMCFPPVGVVSMIAAAVIGSVIPLPKFLR